MHHLQSNGIHHGHRISGVSQLVGGAQGLLQCELLRLVSCHGSCGSITSQALSVVGLLPWKLWQHQISGTISGWSPAMEAEGASHLGYYQWLVSCHGSCGSITSRALSVVGLLPWKLWQHHISGTISGWSLAMGTISGWSRKLREHHNSGHHQWFIFGHWFISCHGCEGASQV